MEHLEMSWWSSIAWVMQDAQKQEIRCRRRLVAMVVYCKVEVMGKFYKVGNRVAWGRSRSLCMRIDLFSR